MTGPQDPLDSTYRVRVPTCFPKATREPSGLPLQGLGKSGESNWDLVLYTGFLGQTYQLQRKDIPSNTGDASGPCDLGCLLGLGNRLALTVGESGGSKVLQNSLGDSQIVLF